MKQLLAATGTLTLLGLAVSTSAQAAIIGVSGAGKIIGAPKSVLVNGYTDPNFISGFNEVQNYLLTQDIKVDGGTIKKGTRVSSHMIFLHQPLNLNQPNTKSATWDFNGKILGVMSDRKGNLEAATTKFLGAPNTLYPINGRRNVGAKPSDPGNLFQGFGSRGLEPNDSYQLIDANTLAVTMTVSQPGDWIRVVTAVPEPLTILGSGVALGFFGFFKKELNSKKKNQQKDT